MYGIQQKNHDNPIWLYMCLDLWSNSLAQNTIWDKRERTVGTRGRTTGLSLQEVLLLPLEYNPAVGGGWIQLERQRSRSKPMKNWLQIFTVTKLISHILSQFTSLGRHS